MTRREKQRRMEERRRRIKHMILEPCRRAQTKDEIVYWHLVEMPRLLEEERKEGGHGTAVTG